MAGYPYYQNYGFYQQPVNQYQAVPDQLQQYRQPYQMQQYQQPAQQSNSQDERIWVQGQGAAEAYLVAPNSFVRLWDSQQAVFYEKRADQTGKPYMDVFEYKRKGAQEPLKAETENNVPDYMKEIESLKKRIKALEDKEVHEDVQ